MAADRPVHLPLDVATPLALIVSETVSNAFKHAFADGRRGETMVTLTEGEAETRLEELALAYERGKGGLEALWGPAH